MPNKKMLLSLLAFAGTLFAIYAIAQASNAEHPASNAPAIKENKSPCHPKNPCHPDIPEKPDNPCHYSTDNSQQDDDHELTLAPDTDHREEGTH